MFAAPSTADSNEDIRSGDFGPCHVLDDHGCESRAPRTTVFKHLRARQFPAPVGEFLRDRAGVLAS